MVRALLEGRKTQTRRIIKPQPVTPFNDAALRLLPKQCPYSKPGDLLWVRESHYLTDDGETEYAICAEDEKAVAFHKQRMAELPSYFSDDLKARHLLLRPSIHMPRWASRLTLEITDVRVQRVKEISKEDAIAEGATMHARCCGFQKLNNGWSMDWSLVGTSSKWGNDGKTLSEGDLALDSP
jgi:hypothetical protein